MSDGQGGGIKSAGEAIGNVAKAGTVDLAKDIFEQIMGGSNVGSQKDDDDTAAPNSSLQQQRMMYQAQKNARMAQIQRNISRLKKERETARKQVQQKEQERQQQLQEQREAAKKAQEEGSFAQKTAGLMKNVTNFVARAGKGEQRGGNKIAG